MLYDKYKKHSSHFEAALQAMGYKSANSYSARCAASLESYGLATTTGSGDARKIAVSEAGERIIRGAPDRDALLAVAALSPNIHQEVWDEFNTTGLPHNDILRQHLVWERPENKRFTEDAVDGFIERIRETFSYARVTEPDSLSGESGDFADEEDDRSGSGSLSLDNTRPGSPANSWSTGGAPMRELPVTLPSLNVAIVKVPERMTELDFTTLTDAIQAWKAALIGPPPDKNEVAPDDTSDEGAI